jgi:hypothetical protein
MGIWGEGDFFREQAAPFSKTPTGGPTPFFKLLLCLLVSPERILLRQGLLFSD